MKQVKFVVAVVVFLTVVAVGHAWCDTYKIEFENKWENAFAAKAYLNPLVSGDTVITGGTGAYYYRVTLEGAKARVIFAYTDSVGTHELPELVVQWDVVDFAVKYAPADMKPLKTTWTTSAGETATFSALVTGTPAIVKPEGESGGQLWPFGVDGVSNYSETPEIPTGAVIPLLSLLGAGMIWLRKKASK